MKPRISAHLRGLEHDDHETIAAQLGDDGLLVATARLDADSPDLMPPQPGRQFLMTVSGICHLQPARTSIQRDIELAFASIDAATNHAKLLHLPRTFLECEP